MLDEFPEISDVQPANVTTPRVHPYSNHECTSKLILNQKPKGDVELDPQRQFKKLSPARADALTPYALRLTPFPITQITSERD